MNVEFHKQVKRMFKFWGDVDLESRFLIVLESLPVFEGDEEKKNPNSFLETSRQSARPA